MVAEMREQPVAHHDSPRLDSAVLAGARIIVVDDDPTAVELITEVLVQAGGEVISCGTADDALQAFARSRPDLIVSDIEMPGQDGYSLIRKLRALGPEQGGKTPAVALTAFGRPEDRIRSLRAGFNIHVSKPVDPAELVAIVASILGRAG
jgi:CheY-like chemotaxis protein